MSHQPSVCPPSLYPWIFFDVCLFSSCLALHLHLPFSLLCTCANFSASLTVSYPADGLVSDPVCSLIINRSASCLMFIKLYWFMLLLVECLKISNVLWWLITCRDFSGFKLRLFCYQESLFFFARSSDVQSRDNQPRLQSLPPGKRLFSVRQQFVKKVSKSTLNQLLDSLLQKDIIDMEEMEAAKIKRRAERARHVIDVVQNKGRRASSFLIDALCELDKHLFDTLGLS